MGFLLITKDINSSRTFVKSTTYVIKGAVRVLKNVELTIENGTTILLVNGSMRSSLIFNTGSKLVAEHIYFRACDAAYNLVKTANNGSGFWGLPPMRKKTRLR